jgi:hypothetical protein
MEQHSPDWFIAFGHHPAVTQLLHFFQQHPANASVNGLHSHFQLVKILDVYWRDTHRPELPWHSFGPKRDFDPHSEAVYIFKRMTVPETAPSATAVEKSSIP